LSRIIVILIGFSLSSYGSYFNFKAGNDEGGWILLAVAFCFVFFGGLNYWFSNREFPFLKKAGSVISKFQGEIALLLCGVCILVFGWKSFFESVGTYLLWNTVLKALFAVAVIAAPLGIVWFVKKLISKLK